MLKNGTEHLSAPLLLLFNTILKFNLYPVEWKKDILGPLHKSGVKTDVNNFRGMAFSSCLGRLFNSMMRIRLEQKCSSFISNCQASGKQGAQTSDHLLVLKHIIHKYIKVKKQKLFVCFFDLKKAFDFVPRLQMLNKLMTEYNIGGQFLKILKNIYTDNEMFIKVNGGLTRQFVTTTGVKQGCVFSPMLFNLYIKKITNCL